MIKILILEIKRDMYFGMLGKDEESIYFESICRCCIVVYNADITNDESRIGRGVQLFDNSNRGFRERDIQGLKHP